MQGLKDKAREEKMVAAGRVCEWVNMFLLCQKMRIKGKEQKHADLEPQNKENISVICSR